MGISSIKTVAENHWDHLSPDWRGQKTDTWRKNSALEISAGDAVKMVYYAAPSAKFFSAFAYFFGSQNVVIILGSFFYKVSGFKTEATMNVLAENTVKLTEIRIDHPPKTEILKSLIERNNIKKSYCNEFSCPNFVNKLS